jgi:hypothetical protein
MDIEQKIRELEERLKKLELIVSNIESILKEKDINKIPKKKISIKEFIISKKPSNDVEITLVIGYFLEKYEEIASFNARDLNDGFQRARESIPKNINDKVGMCCSHGFMMEADQKKGNIKAWILTNSGEKFVENGFKKGD